MAIPLHTFEFDGWENEHFPSWSHLKLPGETSVGCLSRTIEAYLWHPALIIRESIEYTPPSGAPAEAGLYFRVHKNEIGYIGLSRCIRDRLFQRWGRVPFERY